MDLTGYRKRDTIEPRIEGVIGATSAPSPDQSLSGCRPGNDDDISSRAVDDGFQFGLLPGGNGELVQSLLEVIQKRLPLPDGYPQTCMRFRHRFAGVFLWAACRPADHLCHQILEAGGWHAVMGVIYQRIAIQP